MYTRRVLKSQRRAFGVASPPPPAPDYFGKKKPIVGHIPIIAENAKKSIPFGLTTKQLFEEDEQKRETARLALPSTADCVVATRSPDLVKKLLQHQTRTGVARRENGPMFDLFFEELEAGNEEFPSIGPGTLGTNGERWQRLRSAVAPVLMKPNVAPTLAKQFAPIARDFVHLAKTRRDDKAPGAEDVSAYMYGIDEREGKLGVSFDLNRVLMDVALECVFYIITDLRLGGLPLRPGNTRKDRGDELFTPKTHKEFLNAVTLFFHGLSESFNMAPFLPLHRLLRRFFNRGVPVIDDFVHSGRKAMHLAKKAVYDSLRVHPLKEVSDKERGTFNITKRSVRDMLMDHPTLPQEDGLSVLLELMVAGSDTTSTVMVWSLYHLATKPEQFELVRDEVRTLLGETRAQGGSDSEIDERFAQSLLKGAPRLRAVMEETMRLKPTIDTASRVMQEDLPVTDYSKGCPVTGMFADPNNVGRVIPKGALLMPMLRSMGHDKRVFGDDAEEFQHERWTKTKDDKLAFDSRGTPGVQLCPCYCVFVFVSLYLGSALFWVWHAPVHWSAHCDH
ncbi:MAG: hypothetical protein MHM6MM_003371 [Cercozoa sp. M6MM]